MELLSRTDEGEDSNVERHTDDGYEPEGDGKVLDVAELDFISDFALTFAEESCRPLHEAAIKTESSSDKMKYLTSTQAHTPTRWTTRR